MRHITLFVAITDIKISLLQLMLYGLEIYQHIKKIMC